MTSRVGWLAVRKELPGGRALVPLVLGLLLPLVVWSAISYLPFLWHPYVRVDDPGGSSFLVAGMRLKPADFAAENAKLAAAGQPQARSAPANPIFLPAPHEVFRALYTAFRTEPRRPGDP